MLWKRRVPKKMKTEKHPHTPRLAPGTPLDPPPFLLTRSLGNRQLAAAVFKGNLTTAHQMGRSGGWGVQLPESKDGQTDAQLPRGDRCRETARREKWRHRGERRDRSKRDKDTQGNSEVGTQRCQSETERYRKKPFGAQRKKTDTHRAEETGAPGPGDWSGKGLS